MIIESKSQLSPFADGYRLLISLWSYQSLPCDSCSLASTLKIWRSIPNLVPVNPPQTIMENPFDSIIICRKYPALKPVVLRHSPIPPPSQLRSPVPGSF